MEQTERRFYIKFSGAAWDVRAETPEAAINQIRANLDCYASFQPLEIGVDCDEAGWSMKPVEPGESGRL